MDSRVAHVLEQMEMTTDAGRVARFCAIDREILSWCLRLLQLVKQCSYNARKRRFMKARRGVFHVASTFYTRLWDHVAPTLFGTAIMLPRLSPVQAPRWPYANHPRVTISFSRSPDEEQRYQLEASRQQSLQRLKQQQNQQCQYHRHNATDGPRGKQGSRLLNQHQQQSRRQLYGQPVRQMKRGAK